LRCRGAPEQDRFSWRVNHSVVARDDDGNSGGVPFLPPENQFCAERGGWVTGIGKKRFAIEI
jgi:hypothetical protein